MSEPAESLDGVLKPVNKRGSARLSAVQALYQMDISGSRLSEVVEEYENHRIGQEVDGDTYLDADRSWFRSLVGGVVERQTALDPMIHDALPEGWPLERIDTLLRSVMRCGAFELEKRKEVPARVVINEYVNVAKAFFEEDEPRIVNAVLDRLGRELREGELR